MINNLLYITITYDLKLVSDFSWPYSSFYTAISDVAFSAWPKRGCIDFLRCNIMPTVSNAMARSPRFNLRRLYKVTGVKQHVPTGRNVIMRFRRHYHGNCKFLSHLQYSMGPSIVCINIHFIKPFQLVRQYFNWSSIVCINNQDALQLNISAFYKPVKCTSQHCIRFFQLHISTFYTPFNYMRQNSIHSTTLRVNILNQLLLVYYLRQLLTYPASVFVKCSYFLQFCTLTL